MRRLLGAEHGRSTRPSRAPSHSSSARAIDYDRRRVTVDGRAVALTATEYEFKATETNTVAGSREVFSRAAPSHRCCCRAPHPAGTNDAANRRRRTANSANPHDFRSITECTHRQAQAARAPKSSITARPACPPPPSWSPGASPPPTRPVPTCNTAPGCRTGGRRARPR